jgi:hypothetical protein
VLVTQGDPEAIAQQAIALTLRKLTPLLSVPVAMGLCSGRQPDVKQRLMGEMLRQAPADHQRELAAYARAARLTSTKRNRLVALNMLFDMYHGLGCSSLIVEAERSATGSPLLGRNLDLPHRGVLTGYSLVIICRPKGKNAFVSIGFPGVVGVASGMNECGLALAIHGVFDTPYLAPLPNARGAPCMFLCRDILERCAGVDQAAEVLQAAKHTTMLNVVLCDRHGGAVVEITPAAAKVRRAAGGFAACTNHFRVLTPRPTFAHCRRFAILQQQSQNNRLDLPALARTLHEVNQGVMTMQTMVFEPTPLRVHLSIGSSPTSAHALTTLDMAPLLDAEFNGAQ